MCSSAAQPRTEALTLLAKVTDLEIHQGFRNLAVMGGYAAFVRKRLEAFEDEDPPRLPGYEGADVLGRQRLAHALRDWLRRAQGSIPSGRRDATPRPTPRPSPSKPAPAPAPRPAPAPEPAPAARPAPATKAAPATKPAPAPEPTPAPKPAPAPRPDRPRSDDPLEDPVQYLKGVGPRRAELLARLGIEVRGDLLRHVPLRYEDRRGLVPLDALVAGETATSVALIRRGRAVRGRRGPARYEATLEDEGGTAEAVWFGQGYLSKVLRPGTRCVVHGKAIARHGRLVFQSPAFEVLEADEEVPCGLVPVYPLTEGLHQRSIRALVSQAVADLADQVLDPLPRDLAQRLDLLPLAEALRRLHAPREQDDIDQAFARLAFDELFVLQVALAVKQRREQVDDPAASIVAEGDLAARFVASLPFRLTGAQQRARDELVADLGAPRPMARLLQGDVGAGKTVVAATALLTAIDAGFQGALMAPTEILAEQHHRKLTQLCASVGVEPELLLGGMRARPRRQLLDRLETGACRLIVGTHALIEGDLRFRRLGLAVIDEQHRFGVDQRARLREHTGCPNLLVMTATPIPRTLSLTLYGDLDLTLLDEMPPGRKPVKTEWVRPRSTNRIWREVAKEVKGGGRAYVVCALIEQSEKLEAQAATELVEDLASGPLAKCRVALLHGRMSSAEKEDVMTRFRAGEVQVLVATTVIEVGVDVPEASLMVILNAERFGLAQLHQLRGRVGRGGQQARCVLISDGKGEDTRRRLEVLLQHADGFKVAEADLEIRGPGDFFGTKQAGMPELRFADLTRDVRLLEAARREARRLVEDDLELDDPALGPLKEIVSRKFARFVRYRH